MTVPNFMSKPFSYQDLQKGGGGGGELCDVIVGDGYLHIFYDAKFILLQQNAKGTPAK